MKTEQLIDITGERDVVDTFESYAVDFFLAEEKLLMPIINLQIVDKRILGNTSAVRVAFAYLILMDVGEVSWKGDMFGKEVVGKMVVGNDHQKIIDWFLCYTEYGGCELQVRYDKLLIYIPEVSKVGHEAWVPWNTPNLVANIHEETLSRFANLALFPDVICTDLGVRVDALQKLEFSPSAERDNK